MKGKSIYMAPFILSIVSRRSDIDHTVLPANYTMPAIYGPNGDPGAKPFEVESNFKSK